MYGYATVARSRRRGTKDGEEMKFPLSGRPALRRGSALLFAVLVVASMSLSACGRKASPSYPDGAEYPKTYPTE